jgi:hypothetical protein
VHRFHECAYLVLVLTNAGVDQPPEQIGGGLKGRMSPFTTPAHQRLSALLLANRLFSINHTPPRDDSAVQNCTLLKLEG